MKKIIIITLLMFGMSTVAQNKQIVLDYSTAQRAFKLERLDEIKQISSRIILNYDGKSEKVKMFLGESTLNLIRIGQVERLTTTSGLQYLGMTLSDANGEELYFQIYYDEDYGAKLILEDGTMVFLNN